MFNINREREREKERERERCVAPRPSAHVGVPEDGLVVVRSSSNSNSDNK